MNCKVGVELGLWDAEKRGFIVSRDWIVGLTLQLATDVAERRALEACAEGDEDQGNREVGRH